jgi:hypothetical protein
MYPRRSWPRRRGWPLSRRESGFSGLASALRRSASSAAFWKWVTKEVLKDREKKEHAKQAEARRQDQRVERSQKDAERKREREQQQILRDAERKEKEKAKALADIAKLPAAQHEAKLAELAKRIGEDISTLRDEFVEFAAVESSSAIPPTDWYVEPWPEPVTMVTLLPELIDKITKSSWRARTRCWQWPYGWRWHGSTRPQRSTPHIW